MELWQLRTFRTVAKTLHFTKAAEELNLSQPAVSHHIKILEDEIGTRLFERAKEGISMTPAGEIMLRHANRIFAKTEKLKDEIGGSIVDTLNTISIGIIGRSLESPFAFVYSEFKSIYPDYTPKIHNLANSEEVLEGVRAGLLDIGLVALNPECDKLLAIPFSEFRLLFLAGPGHFSKETDIVDAKSAEKLRWALFESGDQIRTFIDQTFINLGIDPKSIFATNDGSIIRDMVSTQQFVTLLPSWGVFGWINEGSLVNIPAPGLESEHDTYIVRKRGTSTPAVDAFVEFLLDLDLPGLKLILKNQKVQN